MGERDLPRVRKLISRIFGVDSTHIAADMDLTRELGVDSLDKLGLTMQLEEEFGVDISDDHALDTSTVRDMVRLVEDHDGNS